MQVDACANVLEKRPLVLIAATASGKTATFFTPLLVIQHLLKNPLPDVPLQLPKKPVVLVVTPLVELGNIHAEEMKKFGLKALSINAETLKAARLEKRDVWAEIRRCDWSMIFLSAERMISRDVDLVLWDDVFRHNLILLALDEAHVLVPWSQDFREAYRYMAQARRRTPEGCAFAVVTATLTKTGLNSLCKEVDLYPGQYHCIRTSVQRSNVRTVLRKLTRPLTSHSFPEISWTFRQGIKAVIFCGSLDLVWHVAVYGWSHYPTEHQYDSVRLWSSITSAEYNQETLDLFANRPGTSVIVATVAFSMGMNVPNIGYSINLGLPDTLEGLVQQNGRAGRDGSGNAWGITYVPSAIISSLKEDITALDTNDSPPLSVSKPRDLHSRLLQYKKAPVGKTIRQSDSMDPNLRSLVLSYLLGLCLERDKNRILSEEHVDRALPCRELGRQLLCGTCDPEGVGDGLPGVTNVLPTPMEVDQPPPVPSTSPPPKGPTPLAKKYQTNLTTWLNHFAQTRWTLKTTAEAQFAPSSNFWRGISLTLVVENAHLMRTRDAFETTLRGWMYMNEDGAALFNRLWELLAVYDCSIERAKAVKKAKAAATRERTRGKRNVIISVFVV
ncbi:ATP-dependent DNA helicase RecQ [Coprinopsis sp. MPI-PUGE-AT-0042]|nr:ATP-dependent DNA helicase RecQ [Coprinopsis sp. MPI-PUGE-AT-0042]